MDVQTLTTFFMWCTIINASLLIFWALMCFAALDFVRRMHSKWFPMPRETFSVVMYSLLGFYKIIVIVFNIVPYVALQIIR